jgi:hypothetical protein
MKKWNRPVLAELAVGFTAKGDLGGPIDGTNYDIDGFVLIGTGGSSINPDDYR